MANVESSNLGQSGKCLSALFFFSYIFFMNLFDIHIQPLRRGALEGSYH